MMQRNKILSLSFLLLVLLFFAYLYKKNPYRIEFIGHYDKIWAHRVNDTIKLKKSTRYFKGVELDLVYVPSQNLLDVNHPPAPSKGLSFQEYVAASPFHTSIPLWLDIKNLDSTNATQILALVEQAITSRNLDRKSVIIETRYPNALPLFSKAGFKTSYYLPYDVSSGSKAEILKKVTRIQAVLKKQPGVGISSNYSDYPLMKAHFPNTVKYLWMIDGFKSHTFKATTILKDSMVAVMLVKYAP